MSGYYEEAYKVTHLRVLMWTEIGLGTFPEVYLIEIICRWKASRTQCLDINGGHRRMGVVI